MAPKSFREVRSVGWDQLVADVDVVLREVERFQYNDQPSQYMKAQMLLTEIARRDQDEQTNKMMQITENTAQYNQVTMELSDEMLKFTRQMSRCTWAITAMTVVILGLTAYMAFGKT